MPDGPANPYGVGFCATETVLKTKQQAQRNGDAAKSRVWKVVNPASLNPMNGGSALLETCCETLVHSLADQCAPQRVLLSVPCSAALLARACWLAHRVDGERDVF